MHNVFRTHRVRVRPSGVSCEETCENNALTAVEARNNSRDNNDEPVTTHSTQYYTLLNHLATVLYPLESLRFR